MRRAALLLSVAAAHAACQPPASCPVGAFQQVASHIASTIKLNTQSDCAGYSRANTINGVANDQAIGPAPICDPDPSDDACVACLRARCCDAVAALCYPDGGAALDPATCAAVPAVNDCLVTAVDGDCEAACGRDS